MESTRRRHHCALCLTSALLVAAPAVAGDWITYVDQTVTRLVADASVGVSDIREKDYAIGDLDRDGDLDLVVVRKIPFTNPGGFRNVLFMNENGVMTDRAATLAPAFLDATDDRDVEIVDVDADGWLDVITAGTFEEQPRILMNLGRVAGVWQGLEYQPNRLPVLTSPTGNGPKFCGLGVGDITGDGRPELYFTDYQNDLEDRLLINNGAGFFSDQTATRLTEAMVDSTFGTAPTSSMSTATVSTTSSRTTPLEGAPGFPWRPLRKARSPRASWCSTTTAPATSRSSTSSTTMRPTWWPRPTSTGTRASTCSSSTTRRIAT